MPEGTRRSESAGCSGCGSRGWGCGGARSALSFSPSPHDSRSKPGARGPGALSQRHRSSPALLPGRDPDSRVAGRSRRTGRRLRLPPTGSGVCASPVNAASDGSTRGLGPGPSRTRNNQKKNPRRGGEQAWPGLSFRRASRGHPTRPSPPGIGGGFNVSLSPAHPGEREHPWFFFFSPCYPGSSRVCLPENQTKT